MNSYHLDDLVGRYIGNYEFQIKDKVLRITEEDVGRIIGLPFNGSEICVGREDDMSHDTKFWKKYFGVNQVTRYDWLSDNLCISFLVYSIQIHFMPIYKCSTIIKEVFVRTISSGAKDEHYITDCLKL